MKKINFVRLPLAILGAVIIISLSSSSASAANLPVATGNDENTDNSSCSLTEAIENINDQAQTNTDCPAGNGTNDTINIPAGTVTLTADLPTLTKSATITGAGMGSSIIDGDGQYRTVSMNGSGSETIDISDLTVKAFRYDGISVEDANIFMNRVEINGANVFENESVISGITMSSFTGNDLSASLNNIYVHDITANAVNVSSGILANITHGSSLDLSVDNTTIENITSTDPQVSGIGLAAGVFDGSNTAGYITAEISTLTVNNIPSQNSRANGVVVLSINADGTASSIDASLDTSTISNNEGQTMFGVVKSSAIMMAGGAPVAGSTVNQRLAVRNVVAADSLSAGSKSNCVSTDISSILGAADGIVSNTITSGGGNLSSDATCTPYFNHAKDQNNLTALGSTISPLADNGGYVPTMALLESSPAINAGVTIAGLTSDARGYARPQGLAYDSGAYESPFTTAVETTSVLSESSPAQTLPKTGQSENLLALSALALISASLLFIARRKLFTR